MNAINLKVGQQLEVENIATETVHPAKVLGVFEAGSYGTPKTLGGFVQLQMGQGRRIVYVKDIESVVPQGDKALLVTAW